MRIAIISPFNPKAISDLLNNPQDIQFTGVSATSVQNLVRGFVKLGHSVTVITSSVSDVDDIVEYSGTNIQVFVVRKKHKHGIFGLTVYPIIRKIIREHIKEFDVIHSHWTTEYSYSILPFSSQIPCFCSVRDWIPYLMSTKKSFYASVQMKVFFHYFKQIMKDCNVTKIGNSNYTVNKLREYLRINDIPLIPNPVNASIILNSRIEKPTDPVFITIANSLTEERKNIITLLQAFNIVRKTFPNAKLKLIGCGAEADFLNNGNKDLSLQNVNFLGLLNQSELMKQIDSSSILVHPAVEETFGNIFLESAARFVPTIGGFNSGAVPYVLEFGRTGCLCDVYNADSIAESMIRLVQDLEYSNYITQNAHDAVIKKYSDNVVCQKHIDLYSAYIMRNNCGVIY